MAEWAEKNIRIELRLSKTGLRIKGNVSILDLGQPKMDFLFHSLSGISAMIPISIYDRIEVQDMLGPQIVLGHTLIGTDLLVLEPSPLQKPSVTEIERVCNQLRLWVKLKTAVALFTGDSAHLTVSSCTVEEPNPGVFFLIDRCSHNLHIINPANSEHIAPSSKIDDSEVWIFGKDSNNPLWIVEGTDSPEQILKRFNSLTNLIQ